MRLLVTISFVLITVCAQAQNRINYSQYMHNHAIFNPGYTELTKDLGGSILYRRQWLAMPGSPKTYIGNAFYNLGESHALSIQFLNDKITAFKHFEIGASYGYKLFLYNSILTLGVKATYIRQTGEYGALTYQDAGDPVFSGSVRKGGVNFGAGAFWVGDDFHLGLGAPYLFNNELVDNETAMFTGMPYNHFFITGGYRFVDEDYFTFYPTGLIKLVKGSPLQMTFDFNCIFQNLIWGSVGYRTDHSFILSTGVIFLDEFKIIYSYDLGLLGRVTRYAGSTHEISLGYGLSLFQNGFSRRKYLNKHGGFMKSYKKKAAKAEKEKREEL